MMFDALRPSRRGNAAGHCRNNPFAISLAVLAAIVVTPAIAAADGRAAPSAGEADWPTYRHDVSRSAVTPATVDLPLANQWTYQAPAAPEPAWPDPQEDYDELPRMRFDECLNVVAVGDAVCFGSSVDNKVYCLDAASGRARWSFFTGAAVRLAPTIAGGRVYFGSDDGWAYCLDLATGKCIWKFHAAPADDRVLARGKLASLWPVRTAVLVRDGAAYFTAGIIPDYRGHIYAVGANDGKLIWDKDSNSMGINQRAIFAPQGYMMSADDRLFVPSGRVMPYCFDRRDGNMIYQAGRLPAMHNAAGGWYWTLIDNLLAGGTQNIILTYDANGDIKAMWGPALRMIATPDVMYLLRGKAVARPEKPEKGVKPGMHVRAINRKTYLSQSRPADGPEPGLLWRNDREGLEEMVLAGKTIFAGGKDEVVAIDAASGKDLWTGKVRGRAVGLAVAGGRLFVSTDAGAIHCFTKGQTAKTAATNPAPATVPSDATVTAAADAILAAAGVDRGHCLIVGDDAEPLAVALARKSELRINCLGSDAASTQKLRESLDAAGVYGTKAVADQLEPNGLPYPDYFANLVIVTPGKLTAKVRPDELLRVLKPCGGVLLSKSPAAPAEWKAAGQAQALQGMGEDKSPWQKLVRGRLKGAADWTHQYGDAGNGGSSRDELVKCPLQVLWYGDPGAGLTHDRHQKNPAPLCVNGQVFYQGWDVPSKQHLLLSFDAYNGLSYWQRPAPAGAGRLNVNSQCGNMACNESGLFIIGEAECYRLDRATGRTVATYRLPSVGDKDTKWAYVAVDGNILLGSSALPTDPEFGGGPRQFSASIFAFDVQTGKLLWQHHGSNIRNNTIAVNDGRVFFVDDPNAFDPRPVPTPVPPSLAQPEGLPLPAGQAAPPKCVRTVQALAVATGKPVWSKSMELDGAGSWGTSMLAICEDNVLLITGAYDDSHVKNPDPSKRRTIALSAADGSPLWSVLTRHHTRPIVVAGTIYGSSVAFDLKTGEPKLITDRKTGKTRPWSKYPPQSGCGTVSGCPGAIFYRYGMTAIFDLLNNRAQMFRATRPGCWINVIASAGLMIEPDSSSGCICYYPLQATFVLKSRE